MATQQEFSPDRWNLYRIFASAFVVGGGLFWTVTVVAGNLAFAGSTVLRSVASGLIWVGVTAVVFVVGLFWERIAAAILGAAALASIAYGLASRGWEPGVWIVYGVFILLPIVISATLYLLAGREHTAYKESEERTSTMPAAPLS